MQRNLPHTDAHLVETIIGKDASHVTEYYILTQ